MAGNLNKILFKEAQKYIAGGVNSPVRSFKAVDGIPIFIKKAKGSKIFGENGRTYIDYCLSWGALILGHAHPAIVKEVGEALTRGTSFGAPTKLETDLAQKITQAISSIELIRLVNSGTEAVMSVIRVARAYTKKNKIIIFEGAYHGHVDCLLTDSAGVPPEFLKYTIKLPYNNLTAIEKTISKNYDDIAAVVVEPVAGNMGVVLPEDGFLEGLRRITAKYGVLLIFDEVITGFRVTYGGVQNLLNIKPDLTCLGKIIGGGFPIGAYGGRKDIMKLVAPLGPVYQAGTLSGNPVAVRAGLATLKILKEANPYQQLQEKVADLALFIKITAQQNNIKLQVNNFGSIFSLFFTDKKVIDFTSAQRTNRNYFAVFFKQLLSQGIYFSPSPLEANFISLAHIEEDLNKTKKAIKIALQIFRRKV